MPEITVANDFRFLFEPDADVRLRRPFRFQGVVYFPTRFRYDENCRKIRIRASNSILQDQDAPDLTHLAVIDPEGKSWPTPTAATLSGEGTAVRWRRLAEEFVGAVGLRADYVHGPARVEDIATEPGALGPQIGDVVAIEPTAPSSLYSEFTRAVFGNPWAGVSWSTPRHALPLTERRALTDAERLFLFRNVARIEAEIVYLRHNSHTVCKVFKEADRAHLGYTTALEMALICLARELEDSRRGEGMFQGVKTAAELANERGTPTSTSNSPPRGRSRCPGCDWWFLPECFSHLRATRNEAASLLYMDCPHCRQALMLERDLASADGDWVATQDRGDT